jgi:hypothetical protein
MTMTILTPTRTASVLGVLVLSAGLLVTSAGAGISDGRSPDTKDAATASASVVRTDLRSPDTLDPAIAAALQAHSTRSAVNLRSPDTLDPAIAAAVQAHSTRPAVDLRSPDTTDAASVVRTDLRSPDTLDPAIAAAIQAATPQVVFVSGGSVFDWTDAGIGAAGGFAIALLLGGIIVLSQRGRQGRLAL